MHRVGAAGTSGLEGVARLRVRLHHYPHLRGGAERLSLMNNEREKLGEKDKLACLLCGLGTPLRICSNNRGNTRDRDLLQLEKQIKRRNTLYP
jgi:hypothetical protein